MKKILYFSVIFLILVGMAVFYTVAFPSMSTLLSIATGLLFGGVTPIIEEKFNIK